MSALSLEIIEGPGAGRSVELRGPIVIGRSGDADVVLDDRHASRRHVRISPAAGDRALVEDLDSSNGTFINQVQVHAPTHIAAGDDLLVGLTVFALRTTDDASRAETAVRTIPPALAVPQHPPQYVAQSAWLGEDGKRASARDLERLLDANVRFRARTAPLAVVALVALIVSIYLGSR
jgi:pSer/pThr/pTyr-binding forkhead associated (FHA) protein